MSGTSIKNYLSPCGRGLSEAKGEGLTPKACHPEFISGSHCNKHEMLNDPETSSGLKVQHDDLRLNCTPHPTLRVDLSHKGRGRVWNQLNLMTRLTTLVVLPSLISGCYVADRVLDVGSEPPLTRPQDPTKVPGYAPVTLPMPAPTAPPVPAQTSNSLWQTGAKGFFKDQRAKRVGDLLTVLVDIDEKAETSNSSAMNHNGNFDASATALLSAQNNLFSDPSAIVDAKSTSKSSGDGSIKRSEKIKTKVATVVTQILPNGNLVIMGRQELRANFEVRELQLAGIVRPADINSDNTITLDKIAEARLSYGGRGTITDVQQPGWAQQMWNTVNPF